MGPAALLGEPRILGGKETLLAILRIYDEARRESATTAFIYSLRLPGSSRSSEHPRLASVGGVRRGQVLKPAFV